MADNIIEEFTTDIVKPKNFKTFLPFIIGGVVLGLIFLLSKRNNSSSTNEVDSGDVADVQGLMNEKLSEQQNEYSQKLQSIAEQYQNENDTISGQVDSMTGTVNEMSEQISNLKTSQDNINQTITNTIKQTISEQTASQHQDTPAPAQVIQPVAKPVATAPAKVVNTSSSREYTVKKGDNLTKIAKEYNTTVDNLMKLNSQIKNKNLIYAGNKITIRG